MHLTERIAETLASTPAEPAADVVAEQLWLAVADGLVEPGDRLPTARQLAVELNLAPGVIEKAYAELARRGVVSNRAGEGTFVAAAPPEAGVSDVAIVGQTAERSLTLTEAHVRGFAELSGDYNPLHFDEAFAARTKFGRLVVQGGLTTGLLHALVAMDLPGPGTVFLSQNWKFTAPVHVGDTITARAEVLSVHETKPVTRLGVRVTRQDGTVVLEGEAWCYTFKPTEEA